MNDVVGTDLQQRYRSQHPLRRPLLVAAVAVLAALALSWLGWVMLFHGRPMARSDMVSFTVDNQHAATATFIVVRRDRDVRASCLLRAQATDHSIVGELNFEVGASQPTTATLTKSVRTEREATSVSLVGCTASGQTQRR